jgi:DNA-binding IclR family transcriptional regulator
MSSLETAVTILRCFSAETPELAVSDVAKRLDVPKSTVSRLMKAMAECALVEQQEDRGRYRVGLLPFRLGQLYQAHVKVLEMVEAEIAALVERTGFTGYICVLNGADIIVLRIRHGNYPVRMVFEPGLRIPAFATAVGKALLARQSDDELRALLPPVLTYERTRLKRPIGRFLGELAGVRERLWAGAQQETVQGMGAVACAVGSSDRQQPVGFALSFPVNAVSPKSRTEIVEQVVAVAARIAEKTGDPIWEGRTRALRTTSSRRAPVRRPTGNREESSKGDISHVQDRAG